MPSVFIHVFIAEDRVDLALGIASPTAIVHHLAIVIHITLWLFKGEWVLAVNRSDFAITVELHKVATFHWALQFEKDQVGRSGHRRFLHSLLNVFLCCLLLAVIVARAEDKERRAGSQ
jgi:membrane-bound metal-dependent hydrolase YbcI (DUF457 family)